MQVGYYSTSVKLFNIILALFSAFTGVMLPRMSLLIESGKMDEFKSLLYKSVDVLFCISVPLVIFTVVMARPIVYLISGKEYEGAVFINSQDPQSWAFEIASLCNNTPNYKLYKSESNNSWVELFKLIRSER